MYDANPKTTNLIGNPRFSDVTRRASDDESSFENFENLTSKLLKVPKEEVDEKRAERRQARKRE